MTGRFEVRLVPLRGDGRLTEHDVEIALDGLPRAGRVEVRLDDCEDFEGAAPARLARELSGCEVTHHFARAAWGINEHWVESYERAAAEYLAIEAALLARGA